MKTEKYRKEYLASLFGSVYDSVLDRTFPIVNNPQKYTNWCDLNPALAEHRDVINSKVWVVSDHHFNHANIMKYANRKFSNVPEMNQFMIDQHNAVVKSDDVVILGGDVAFCATNKANDFLSQLNGYKILIIGNHDWERKTGKLKVYDVDEIHMSYFIELDGTDILITHVPFYSTVMMDNKNLKNIHGHIHDKKMNHPRYINMCVEHIDYQPVLLSELITG